MPARDVRSELAWVQVVELLRLLPLLLLLLDLSPFGDEIAVLLDPLIGIVDRVAALPGAPLTLGMAPPARVSAIP